MNIIISPCSYRYLDKRTAWAIAKLSSYQKDGIRFFQTAISPDAAIDRARSIVASDFVRSDKADILFFIDDDVVFNPEDVLKLVQHIQDGKFVVGAVYATKSDPPQISSRFFDNQRIEFNRNSKPEEIMYLAGGFTMIHKKVFEKMCFRLPLCFANSKTEKSFWPFFMPFVVKKMNGFFKKQYEYLSEDFAFCHRAKDCGFDIWIDPSIRLGHVGNYVYTLEDMKRLETSKINDENIAITKAEKVIA